MSTSGGSAATYVLLEAQVGKSSQEIKSLIRPTNGKDSWRRSSDMNSVDRVRLAGSLFRDTDDQDALYFFNPTKSPSTMVLRSLDKSDLFIACPSSAILRVTFDEMALLLGINNCNDRLRIASDKTLLYWLLHLQPGDNVIVAVNNGTEELQGFLRYKGPISSQDPAIVFGVELVDNPGRGNSDGTYKERPFFQVAPNCAVFVGAHRITPPRQSSSRRNAPLAIGERVVWMADHGPECGTVKWIGILKEVSDDWTVGVAFDNPVGTGTGKFKNEQLFRAPQNHASLIPIMGLLKEADVLGSHPTSSTSTGDAPQRTKTSSPSMPFSEDDLDAVAERIGDIHWTEVASRLGVPRDFVDECRKQRKPAHTMLRWWWHQGAMDSPTSSRFDRLCAALQNVGAYDVADELKRKCYSEQDPWPASAGDGCQNGVVPERFRMEPHQPPLTGVGSGNRTTFYSPTGDNHVEASMRRTAHDRMSPSTKRCLPDVKLSQQQQQQPQPQPKHRQQFSTNSTESSPRQSELVTSSKANQGYSTENVNPLYEWNHGEGASDYGKGVGGTISRREVPSPRDAPSPSHFGVNGHHENGEVRSADERRIPSALDRDQVPGLEVGSVVEVELDPQRTQTGVIRWIGQLRKADPNEFITAAGLEMDEEASSYTDGTYLNKRYFTCAPGRAFFCPLRKCRLDSRFRDANDGQPANSAGQAIESFNFGEQTSPVVSGNVPPPNRLDLRKVCGDFKGIQGHHNSCYLDATLFSMFAFSSVFDQVLYRPADVEDIPQYGEIQRVLKECIVNPLRRHFYVRADRTLQLRRLLDKLSDVDGMMGDEKDPEEFLRSLLEQTLKMEPLIRLTSDQRSYFYQIFVDRDESLLLPSIQQLLEKSMFQSNLRFAQAPACLIVQMPRCGKEYKMYKRIIPSLELDISDMIEDSPRQCHVCRSAATVECRDCFRRASPPIPLRYAAYCDSCLERHRERSLGDSEHPHSDIVKLSSPPAFLRLRASSPDRPIPRVTMELFAVLCINTSHYVAFVKAGGRKSYLRMRQMLSNVKLGVAGHQNGVVGSSVEDADGDTAADSHWLFFDSMAGRHGLQAGYNIPRVAHVPDFEEWVSDEKRRLVEESLVDDKVLPERVVRLLGDAYMCFYQDPHQLDAS